MNHPGKWLALLLLALAPSGALRAEDEYLSAYDGVFRDPRAYHGFGQWIRNGEWVKEGGSISHSILLIDWRPAPDGQSNVFQISGLDGYYKKHHIKAFLREFYKLSEAQREAGESPFLPLENIVAAANNWGSFSGFESLFLELSAQYGLSINFADGGAFDRALLMKEPPPRLARIEEAFRRATAGEENPALNPQRRLLDTIPLVSVTLEVQPLAPDPPGSWGRSSRTRRTWFTCPYATMWGTTAEWSMGWGPREPSRNEALSVMVQFSQGKKWGKGDPYSGEPDDPAPAGHSDREESRDKIDPFSRKPEEPWDLPEGELAELHVSGSVSAASSFLPDCLADSFALTVTASRRPSESEEVLIQRFLTKFYRETFFLPESTSAGENIEAFETILREILLLSRK